MVLSEDEVNKKYQNIEGPAYSVYSAKVIDSI